MSLYRIPGREQLNITSDSPFAKSPLKQKKKPLDSSPFVYKRTAGYIGNPPQIIGSPYPTPLDDVRTSHSYSGNDASQTFRRRFCDSPNKALKARLEFASQENEFEGDSSPVRTKRRLLNSVCSPTVAARVAPTVQGDRSTIKRSPRQAVAPSAILNPNKAVLTLNASGKILTVNDMTTLLLGEDLVQDGTTIFDLLSNPAEAESIRENLKPHCVGVRHSGYEPLVKNKIVDGDRKVAAEEDILESEGVVVFSGNVVTMETGDMGEMPVSLWMKELPVEKEEEPTWIAVVEPITTTTTKVTVSSEGLILKTDDNFVQIFGSEAALDNDNLFNYVSAIGLLDSTAEELGDQASTGRAKDGEMFPISASVRLKSGSDVSSPIYEVKIKLCSNISGLMVVDESGYVLQYNHNFTRLLFGYGSKELEGQNITRVLPEFHKVSSLNDFKKNFFCPDENENDGNIPQMRSGGTHESAYGVGAYKNNSSIPYIDESKENTNIDNTDSVQGPGELLGPACGDRLRLTGSSYGKQNSNTYVESSSCGSPNKAFIVSDSQFTLSSSKNISQKTASSSIPSFNQTNSKDGGRDTPPVAGSPIRNANITPNNIMKDITNSLNMFNISEYPDQTRFPHNLSLITSTPAVTKLNGGTTIQEGSYFSVGKHKDGSAISVLYQIRGLWMNGKELFCLWITWEPNDTSVDESNLLQSSVSETAPNKSLAPANVIETLRNPEINSSPIQTSETSYGDVDISPYLSTNHAETLSSKRHDETLSASSDEETTRTDGSSANEYSLAEASCESEENGHKKVTKKRSFSESDIKGTPKSGNKELNSSKFEEPEWVLTSGDYTNHYTILRQIGKGAFGYVKLSYRNTDGLIVITKFIKKSQVYKDSWTVDDKTGKRVCMEVDLLMKLDHPNIVRALAFFENEKYFQLVMEKWGSGMDLFEFIDRNPALDEPIISYIFRQIVSPLLYLRSLNIIHRDIKDENIIINQKFNIKLIDFGSATYLDPDKKFTQFAGTIEYCSPEVLKGHKYHGPELEIWSLGITLYTLVFGENPFSTVDQVLKEQLILPLTYSNGLFSLLNGMLNKDPKERMQLDEIAEHKWTNQEVDMEFYSFEDLVPCDPEELFPVRFITDYGSSEETFSTTSSSFVYEDIQSISANESSQIRSPNNISALHPDRDYDVCDVTSRTEDITDVTASMSRSSSQGSITIDSSAFFGSAQNKDRQKTQSSLSVCSNASLSANVE